MPQNNQTQNQDQNHNQTTHFGYQTIPTSEKQTKVEEVFRSVADKYDLMNDAMSLGVHRLWKRFALSQTNLKPGEWALDLAAGTGDLTRGLAKQVGKSGYVVSSDINIAMLKNGRERSENLGFIKAVSHCILNAEKIPFSDNVFDAITLGFGLRNMTDKSQALKEAYRVLKPGGKCLILEFSKPLSKKLSKIYDLYSFKILPKLGKLLAKDADSYQYLAESIRKHPDQNKLKEMMLNAGFGDVMVHNLSLGIVAVHVGYKY